MTKFQHDVMLRIVKVLDVLMIELPFAACWLLYYSKHIYKPVSWKGNVTILALFFILYILMGRIYDAFWMSKQRVSELVYGQILGAMAVDGILYIVICLMSGKLCNLWPGIAAIAGQLVMAAIWSVLAHKWYYKTFIKLNDCIDQIIFIINFQFVTLLVFKLCAKLHCIWKMCNNLRFKTY